VQVSVKEEVTPGGVFVGPAVALAGLRRNGQRHLHATRGRAETHIPVRPRKVPRAVLMMGEVTPNTANTPSGGGDFKARGSRVAINKTRPWKPPALGKRLGKKWANSILDGIYTATEKKTQ